MNLYDEKECPFLPVNMATFDQWMLQKQWNGQISSTGSFET